MFYIIKHIELNYWVSIYIYIKFYIIFDIGDMTNHFSQFTMCNLAHHNCAQQYRCVFSLQTDDLRAEGKPAQLSCICQALAVVASEMINAWQGKHQVSGDQGIPMSCFYLFSSVHGKRQSSQLQHWHTLETADFYWRRSGSGLKQSQKKFWWMPPRNWAKPALRFRLTRRVCLKKNPPPPEKVLWPLLWPFRCKPNNKVPKRPKGLAFSLGPRNQPRPNAMRPVCGIAKGPCRSRSPRSGRPWTPSSLRCGADTWRGAMDVRPGLGYPANNRVNSNPPGNLDEHPSRILEWWKMQGARSQRGMVRLISNRP